jgi:hypothetical protein
MMAQYNLYDAMLQEVYPLSWFAGVFWWAWETSPYAGGPCDDQYNPCRKPAATLLSTFYKENSVAPARHSASSAPRSTSTTIYTNGALAAGWQSWSYSGSFDFTDPANAFPGHTASLGVSSLAGDGAGALSFWNTGVTVDASSVLEFNLLAANLSSSISVQVCTCNDCSSCGLPLVAVNQFFPSSNNCSLPSASWSSSLAAIPMVFMNINLVTFNRLSFVNTGTDGLDIDFLVDNIAIVSSS